MRSPTAPGATRLRKAWRVQPKGWDATEIVFAPTASKARREAWHAIGGVFDVRYIDVNVRRERGQDVVLPSPDPLAARLTDAEWHCLLHAFGATTNPLRAGYRDYFYTRHDDPPLVALVKHGLMSLMEGYPYDEGMAYFVLTDRGKHVALSLTPAYRQ